EYCMGSNHGRLRTTMLGPSIIGGGTLTNTSCFANLKTILKPIFDAEGDMSDMRHPVMTRRTAIQAGAIGLLGLGVSHLNGLRALADSPAPRRTGGARAAIYIFLSGGLA